jgi:hypothetical protein
MQKKKGQVTLRSCSWPAINLAIHLSCEIRCREFRTLPFCIRSIQLKRHQLLKNILACRFCFTPFRSHTNIMFNNFSKRNVM